MNKCYKCDTDLIAKEFATPEQIELKKIASEEHIIPNFCGGQRSSWDLLCKGCNECFGSELEGPLSQELILRRILPFKLDRGNQKNRKVSAITRETKQEVLVDGKLRHIHKRPTWIISEDGELKDLNTKNPEEAKVLLKKFAKKNPKINAEEILKKMRWKQDLDERIDFTATIGSDFALRAIVKIAVNYYLYKGKQKSFILDAINFVCLPNQVNKFVCFYYPIVEPYKASGSEILHIIYLRGDSKKKLLYCYIELFYAINFIVVLNENYDGEDFTHQYCYDVITNEEPQKEIRVGLFRNPLRQIDDIFYNQAQKSFSKKLDRVYEIAAEIQKYNI